jgi:hypothetical protein
VAWERDEGGAVGKKLRCACTGNELMEVLAATQVDSTLARPLLRGGGAIVLAKLRSEGRAERQAARRFLVQIAGRDLGDDSARWHEWVRDL